jgi:peptidoglycan/LPS O-acetylase OafA/YrhL
MTNLVATESIEHTASATSPRRLPAVDGLRAVAASLVLGHHLGAAAFGGSITDRGHPFLGLFVGTVGSSGVELFFVLSGLVLVRPYLRYGRRMDVGTYLRRRAERLFPPFLPAWLLAGTCVYTVTNYHNWYSDSAGVPHFHLRDWLLQLGILYFGNHYAWAWWSLTVELMFYLLIPFLLRPLSRVPVGVVPALCVLGAVTGVALFVPLFHGAWLEHALLPHFSRFLMLSHCFVAGLLLSRQDFPRSVALTLMGLGAAFLVISAIYSGVTCHVGYGLFYTGLVARALDPTSAIARLLSRWHFVWLGERSYSLFLIHCSVIVLVYHFTAFVIPRGAAFILVTRVVSVPLSIFVAMCLFYFVERQFARGLETADSFWPRRPTEPQPLGEGMPVTEQVRVVPARADIPIDGS